MPHQSPTLITGTPKVKHRVGTAGAVVGRIVASLRSTFHPLFVPRKRCNVARRHMLLPHMNLRTTERNLNSTLLTSLQHTRLTEKFEMLQCLSALLRSLDCLTTLATVARPRWL